MNELYIVNSVADPSDYPDAALNADGQAEAACACATSPNRPNQRRATVSAADRGRHARRSIPG
jgi:hypothetical protein